MTQNVISEEELKLLLSSDSDTEQKEQPPHAPKLTMKYLHERIGELQRQNLLLAKRIDELEQQLNDYCLIRGESASAVEYAAEAQPANTAMGQAEPPLDGPPFITVPRSERHPTPDKKTIWSSWFRPRT